METGGAERMAVNYANALSEKITFSGLVVTREEGGLKKFINQDVDYFFISKKSNIDLKCLWNFRNYCFKNEVTHIHAHSSSFFWATLIKLFIPKIKIIWHDHYGNSEFLNKRPKAILKFASYFFLLIIVVNEKLFSWCKNELFCKEVIYLNNFPDINEKENAITHLKGNEGKRILYLANLRPQKNHELLIEIAELLKKTKPDWSFHLVGVDFNDAYSSKIKKEIIRLNLDKNIYVYGAQNDISNIIKQSAFGILTSLSEGLPVSLLEFGLMGKTVIATNVGDIGRVIINKKTGVLINDFNKDAICSAIEKMIADNVYRESLENNIKNHIIQHFSSEAVIAQYLTKINK